MDGQRSGGADKVPRVKTMRWSLQAFVERYRIPLGPLRDWEQAQCEPDAAARAY